MELVITRILKQYPALLSYFLSQGTVNATFSYVPETYALIECSVMTLLITRPPFWSTCSAVCFVRSVMVDFCAVYGCGSQGDWDKKSFFRLPAIRMRECERNKELSDRRRAKWLANIGRDIKSSNLAYIRVCSNHFVKGE